MMKVVTIIKKSSIFVLIAAFVGKGSVFPLIDHSSTNEKEADEKGNWDQTLRVSVFTSSNKLR